MKLTIKEVSLNCEEAVRLRAELSKELKAITGNGGEASFHAEAMEEGKSTFLIAYEDQNAVGCGAIYPYTEEIAEIKRVYAKERGKGIGTAILQQLEEKASILGYQKIYIETRKKNEGAVRFYLTHGYRVCENYGKYKGREEAICFEKEV